MRDVFPDPDCAAARDALPDLLGGRLAGGARGRVERHAASCAECAAELALLRRARSALHSGAPALDLAAIAAAVRAATIPAQSTVDVGPAAPSGAPGAARHRPTPPRLGAPSRWRAGRPIRALAAAVLVAVGAGAAWLGRGSTGAGGARAGQGTEQVAVVGGAGVAAGSDVATPGGAAGPGSARGAATSPAVLAAAEPALGSRFDDLTDDELQAVIAAVEGAEPALLSEELDPAAPDVGGGG